MGLRPSSDLIQSLRVTLQKVEESFASAEDQSEVAELKRILLLRIADIEAVEALREAQSEEGVPEPTIPATEAQPVESLVEPSPQPANAIEIVEPTSIPPTLLDG